ncbi:cytochrome c6, chloroplastic isoform X1 [Phoenix dactylifera]|uniref:Cytochrome c-553 n=1 Tax=Phoenix dactylifera TaxID=42345 RepID=A0A8B8ZE78_PHODC|nr:cytochrome c6, chloroplastic isoform X1 [Phoenix dactylifera]
MQFKVLFYNCKVYKKNSGNSHKHNSIYTVAIKKNQKKHNKHLLGDRKMHNLYVHHTIKAFASYFGISAVSFSQPISEGRALFQKACIGCHDMGGNILQPGATLFMKDLERNGVATEEGIYNITYYGKGRMPGFGEKCTPKGQCTFGPRLQEDEIKLLAEFVKSQADRGWPNIKSYGD